MKKQYKKQEKYSMQHSSIFQKNNPHSYSKLLGISSTFLMIILFSLNAAAQTAYPKISQNWTQIFEDESVMMEISAQVIQCDSSSNAIIFLEIFNETPNDDTAKFELTITNPSTGDDETEDITYFIQGARIEKPECGSSNNSALRVTIPSGYNPETIKLSVTY